MRDLAQNIIRQRLLIEAKYDRQLTEADIRTSLLELAGHLDLRTYGEPIIHSTSGEGKDVNQGYDAFVPLIDSGIALYVWINESFLSCVLYTCKRFDTQAAVNFVKEYFNTTEIESRDF